MEIESARIFVKVIQLNSFTKAAEVMKLPKSTISRTISRLELEAGTKLILRTTRSMTLTPCGQTFFENCLAPVSALEDAWKFLQGKDSVLSGVIRLTAPEDLGTGVISSAIGLITTQHPGLSFELNYTDQIIDLVKEGYDIAIRIGKLSSSRYKARSIGEIKMILVASPQYLKKHGPVKKPNDLSGLDCINYNSKQGADTWRLVSKSSKVSLRIKPRIIANQMTSLLNLVNQGAGIGLLPQYLCKESLKNGGLQRVLPEWESHSYPVSVVIPPGYGNSSRLKLVSDSLLKAIQGSLKAN